MTKTTTTTCTMTMMVMAKRPIPKLVVHRMRNDRPKEAHPDEYAVLERASESGEDALFWEVAERSLFKHRDRPDIVFFIEYKICEFKCVAAAAVASLVRAWRSFS
jgi:hypothetical protein